MVELRVLDSEDGVEDGDGDGDGVHGLEDWSTGVLELFGPYVYVYAR